MFLPKYIFKRNHSSLMIHFTKYYEAFTVPSSVSKMLWIPFWVKLLPKIAWDPDFKKLFKKLFYNMFFLDLGYLACSPPDFNCIFWSVQFYNQRKLVVVSSGLTKWASIWGSSDYSSILKFFSPVLHNHNELN